MRDWSGPAMILGPLFAIIVGVSLWQWAETRGREDALSTAAKALAKYRRLRKKLAGLRREIDRRAEKL